MTVCRKGELKTRKPPGLTRSNSTRALRWGSVTYWSVCARGRTQTRGLGVADLFQQRCCWAEKA